MRWHAEHCLRQACLLVNSLNSKVCEWLNSEPVVTALVLYFYDRRGEYEILNGFKPGTQSDYQKRWTKEERGLPVGSAPSQNRARLIFIVLQIKFRSLCNGTKVCYVRFHKGLLVLINSHSSSLFSADRAEGPARRTVNARVVCVGVSQLRHA